MTIDDGAQQLTPEQFELYLQAVEKEGEPAAYLGGEPNAALQMIWGLSKEYRLCDRFAVEITDEGIIRYALHYP
ncbi:hypothetical protein JXC34_01565 [Candidatus Woesearchaeota archaeon]|nr:hypothetical protein [Candidatus Woesearchaeota archaeon]